MLPKLRQVKMRLTFRVPYTGHEVLVLAGGKRVAGLAYDPLSTDTPVAWLGGCEHCLRGDRRVPLKVRRAVRCLATLRPTASGGYSVKVSTGQRATHAVEASREAGSWLLTARRLGGEALAPLAVCDVGGAFTVLSGDPQGHRSPVLLRTLRMLLAAKDTSEREVEAALRGLGGATPARWHSHGDEVRELAGYVWVSLDATPGLAERVRQTTRQLTESRRD